MLDERTQFRRHLLAVGIVEKHTWPLLLETFQHTHELARFHRRGDDGLRKLCEAQAFDRRAEQGRIVARNERARDNGVYRLVAIEERPWCNRSVRTADAQAFVCAQLIDTR